MRTSSAAAEAAPEHTRINVGLHEIFTDAARRRPDGAAVISGTRTVSYSELDALSTAWAASLAERGVVPGDLVPILLPRGPELITALIAVLKCGAAYALLDPTWPRSRIADVCKQLDSRLAISESAVTETGDSGMPLWRPSAAPGTAPAGFTPLPVDGSAACCVFFTSGTTGRPKGVVTPHRATARLFGRDSFSAFTPDTVIPLAAPTPWDAFTLELWGALLVGGTSVVVPEPFLSAASLRAGVADHGVNTVWLTSSLFNLIVDEDPGAFTGLGTVMTGGERLSTEHVRRFLLRHPGIALLNGYGPVENTVFATTHRIAPADAARDGGIPLGHAVPGTAVWVLDGDRPCAAGEPGEICIGGDGLALRYLQDPELTAAKFPSVEIDGVCRRIYRSGDLGVLTEDGLLEYRGRADRQVKIRGHRIEPAEVERQIEQLLPAVRACCVLARRDDAGNTADLVAFCVPHRPGDPLDGAATALAGSMVSYQLPSAVLSVPVFPLTGQGKLDERTLLELAPRTAAPEPQPAEPDFRDIPSLIRSAFTALLGLPDVADEASFFTLGGSSLEAARACARIGALLDRPIPVSRLYQHPTVAEFARWLDSGDRPAAPAASVEVSLSPMQLLFLTRHAATPDDRTNHCLMTWLINGTFDPEKLEKAIAVVFDRHESLRAAYIFDPEPAAVLTDIAPPALEVLDAEPSRDAAVAALRAVLSEPLEPMEGDVMRTVAVPVADRSSWIFGCVLHHIAFDGRSEAVLARELSDAYNGVPASSEPLTLRGSAARISALDAEADIAGQTRRAAAALAGTEDLRWPDGPRSAAPGEPGVVATRVAPQAAARIGAFANRSGTSRFTVLLSEWAHALAAVTGQSDFAVGTPVAQRSESGLDDAIGCHINMVAIRLRDPATGGGPAGLRGTADAVGRAFAAQDAPISAVLDLAPHRTTRRPTVFQVLFALQDSLPPRLDLDGACTEFLRQPYLDLPLELHTEIWPTPDGGLDVFTFFRREAVPEPVAHDVAARFTQQLDRFIDTAKETLP